VYKIARLPWIADSLVGDAPVGTIRSEVTIHAPKEKVWEALRQYGEIYRYAPSIGKSWLTSSQLEGAGASRHCDLVPMGSTLERITEWRAETGYTFTIEGGQFVPPFDNNAASYDLVDEGDKTIVKFRFDYQLKYGPLGKLMDKLVFGPQFSRGLPRILTGLKHFVETGEEVDQEVFKRLGEEATPA
jgi:ligand-binding SRPBCC domain-containing protein